MFEEMTEQQAREHTHFSHLGRTASSLTNILNNQKNTFLNDRFLGVLKNHPFRGVIPQLLFALERLLGGLEVDRVA